MILHGTDDAGNPFDLEVTPQEYRDMSLANLTKLRMFPGGTKQDLLETWFHMRINKAWQEDDLREFTREELYNCFLPDLRRGVFAPVLASFIDARTPSLEGAKYAGLGEELYGPFFQEGIILYEN